MILLNKKGDERRVAVIPDGFFRLCTSTRDYSWFLETDLGTVTAQASHEEQRDWSRKVRA